MSVRPLDSPSTWSQAIDAFLSRGSKDGELYYVMTARDAREGRSLLGETCVIGRDGTAKSDVIDSDDRRIDVLLFDAVHDFLHPLFTSPPSSSAILFLRSSTPKLLAYGPYLRLSAATAVTISKI
ncbi:hypothetical protein SCHPADRAFT_945989 [Schizopora paradoxa]|uniref:Uncharacterized protein n=1 Tax=Schizopora paradoxa TaxID=27342 RepID=A0A0H2R5E1_9AGAM|nr:hypothetical protein SCHPADRAFT_945989 [Schizopora paradoxa]